MSESNDLQFEFDPRAWFANGVLLLGAGAFSSGLLAVGFQGIEWLRTGYWVPMPMRKFWFPAWESDWTGLQLLINAAFGLHVAWWGFAILFVSFVVAAFSAMDT